VRFAGNAVARAIGAAVATQRGARSDGDLRAIEARMTLNALSDDDLVARLHALCLEARRVDVQLVVHLVEVEERRLHLRSACSSLFDFCRRRLGMSEGAAFRRINAARLVRRFPGLLAHLEAGRVHLSTLVLLRDHLSEESLDALVAETAGRSRLAVLEILARRAPRPDVPSRIRKLPASSADAASAAEQPALGASPSVPARSPAPALLEPLSPARYKLQLTASAALRAKLERARDLMRHRHPSGDLAAVVECALDALLEKLEKERLGKTSRMRRTRGSAKPGHVSRAARREVFARDGEQCTFVDEHDRRCPARAFLEVDHVTSRAQGGSGEASNLRVLCRAHNRLHAEEVFGREHVAERIHFRQRKSETTAATPDITPSDASLDVARRGLVKMGFRDTEARRAVQAAQIRNPGAAAIPEILREALAVLTA